MSIDLSLFYFLVAAGFFLSDMDAATGKVRWWNVCGGLAYALVWPVRLGHVLANIEADQARRRYKNQTEVKPEPDRSSKDG